MKAFRVGDRVTVTWGFTKAEGTITEDRGRLGVGRRRLYQVEVPVDPYDPMVLELTEDEIEPFDLNGKEKPLSKAAVIEYLKNGGLISILHSNISERRDPTAWLRFDTQGNITHTFVKERGRLGGATVPARALYEDKVFATKREEVLRYLRSFGLSNAQAEDVLAEVGTAP